MNWLNELCKRSNVQSGLTGTYTANYTDQNGCSASKNYYLKVEVCTGLPEPNGNNAVSIYPNPFNNGLNIEISAEVKISNAFIKIVDVTGKEINRIFINNSITNINEGALMAGLYFYSIYNNGAKIAGGKLIVQD
jgi:hypothetical protein